MLGRDPDEFGATWRSGRAARETGSLADYLATLGLSAEQVESVAGLRREATRSLMASPRPGAVETLRELRRRGLRVGLITVCSDDLPAVWPQTAFAGLFDAKVFSCDVRLRKPDPAIYLVACDRLGVPPENCMFVGDGANDELAGAKRVGMRAVQIHRLGEEADWNGARITSVAQVLDLV